MNTAQIYLDIIKNPSQINTNWMNLDESTDPINDSIINYFYSHREFEIFLKSQGQVYLNEVTNAIGLWEFGKICPSECVDRIKTILLDLE